MLFGSEQTIEQLNRACTSRRERIVRDRLRALALFGSFGFIAAVVIWSWL